MLATQVVTQVDKLVSSHEKESSTTRADSDLVLCTKREG